MLRLVSVGVMAIVPEIMYKKLGVGWTLTLLCGISFLFLPAHCLFYWKGVRCVLGVGLRVGMNRIHRMNGMSRKNRVGRGEICLYVVCLVCL